MIDWQLLSFQYPWLLLLIPVWILGLWYLRKKGPKTDDLRFSFPLHPGLGKGENKLITALFKLRNWCFHLAIIALILALAQPGSWETETVAEGEGIDIMIALDLSSSMLAQDFQPDRLEVSKKLMQEFVENRMVDRIGLVGFAGESFTKSPLTTDHNHLIQLIGEFELGLIRDGTAIGMGLATALSRLQGTETGSGVVILLTDGVNNTGYIDPLTAAQIAVEMEIRVYTIGVGSHGVARAPVDRRRDGSLVFGNVRVEIDEELLKEISAMTGGEYFRADDEEALQDIYHIIDEMEKTEIRIENVYHFSSQYRYPLAVAISLLLLYILPPVVFRTFP